jgi:hypothetical protein
MTSNRTTARTRTALAALVCSTLLPTTAFAQQAPAFRDAPEASPAATTTADPGAVPTAPSPHTSTRTIVGWTTIGAGVILLTTGAIEAQQYFGTKSTVAAYARTVPDGMSVASACADGTGAGSSTYRAVCGPGVSALSARAQSSSLLATAFGGLGLIGLGTGVYFLLTGRHAEVASTALQVIPHVSPAGGGLELRAKF